MTIRSAFTLIEIMIVIVILAILTIAALPDRESTIQAEGDRDDRGAGRVLPLQGGRAVSILHS